MTLVCGAASSVACGQTGGSHGGTPTAESEGGAGGEENAQGGSSASGGRAASGGTGGSAGVTSESGGSGGAVENGSGGSAGKATASGGTGGGAAHAGAGGSTAGAGGSGGAAGHATAGRGGGGGTAGQAGAAGAGGVVMSTTPPPEQWLALWGGTSEDFTGGFSISPNHVIVAAGAFASASIDLDPTDGTDIRKHLTPVSEEDLTYSYDAFVVWLNADGTYRNGCTIQGNPGSLGLMQVAAGPNDEAVLTGEFTGTVDFDPGPGEEKHSVDITGGTYLMSLSADCELNWVYTFSDANSNDLTLPLDGRTIAVDKAGSIYVIGEFTDFDFDFGPGVHEVTAPGPEYSVNTFLLKLDASAGLDWVVNWGATSPSSVGLTGDDQTVVVSGSFGAATDLDSSAAVDSETPMGTTDAYALVFDSDGNQRWLFTHNRDATSRFDMDVIGGGADGSLVLGCSQNYYLTHRSNDGTELWTWDLAYQVHDAKVAPDGRLLLLGRLEGSQQPDPAQTSIDAPIYGEEFLSVFEADGTFVSSLTYGGQASAQGSEVMLYDGYAYVAGNFDMSSAYLPVDGKEQSFKPVGARDVFLFKTKLP